MPTATAEDPGRGRDADTPRKIPARGWKDIFWRVWAAIGDDRVLLVAAGVTFYLLLALFPALAAFVSLYGLFADPASISEQIEALRGVLPAEGLTMLTDQLNTLASGGRSSLTWGFLLSFAVAFWSANNGVKSIIEAMNIAHDERETRSFVRVTLLSFTFTLGAMTIGILMILAVGVVPALLAVLNLGSLGTALVWMLRWPLVLLVVALAMTMLYRYAPDREPPEWRWVTWGSGIATVVWLLGSIAFTVYLENFANYGATYGSLGALIGLLLWIWVATIILIVGAEINAEMEHQTARDTTTGPEEPMGERGARMADTLGGRAD